MDSGFGEGIYTSQIAGFENYVVTSEAKIINLNTGREMVLSRNQNGDIHVGLVGRDGVQYRRSVKVLFADAFLPGKSLRFNTPVVLNGKKDDLRISNLCWRPRWFAWRYAHQFVDPQLWYFQKPVRDVYNGFGYESIFHAATSNGILCDDILLSIKTGSRVWPTGGQFEYI